MISRLEIILVSESVAGIADRLYLYSWLYVKTVITLFHFQHKLNQTIQSFMNVKWKNMQS